MLREKSCGIVPFREVDGKILYLVISSAVTKREHWEFPKGGVEEGEKELETALRELWEETGVSDVRVLPGYREPIRYIYRRPEGLVSKQVVYFIGRVGDPKVVLREREAKDYRWADYEEARKLLRHANARALLERCHAFITGRPLPPSMRERYEQGDSSEALDSRSRRRPHAQGAPRGGQARPAAPQRPGAPAKPPAGRAPAQAEGPAGAEPPRRRKRRRRRGRGGGQPRPAEARQPSPEKPQGD